MWSAGQPAKNSASKREWRPWLKNGTRSSSLPPNTGPIFKITQKREEMADDDNLNLPVQPQPRGNESRIDWECFWFAGTLTRRSWPAWRRSKPFSTIIWSKRKRWKVLHSSDPLKVGTQRNSIDSCLYRDRSQLLMSQCHCFQSNWRNGRTRCSAFSEPSKNGSRSRASGCTWIPSSPRPTSSTKCPTKPIFSK